MKDKAPIIKQEKNFEYHGAGFPVIISDVRLESFGDDWIVLVDFRILENILARELTTKPARLTGNEVKFLRQWLELGMAELAAYFGYTAPAVHKWQQKGLKASAMHWSAEVQLRLLVLEKLGTGPQAFLNTFRALSQPLPEGTAPAIRVPGAKVALRRERKSDHQIKNTIEDRSCQTRGMITHC